MSEMEAPKSVALETLSDFVLKVASPLLDLDDNKLYTSLHTQTNSDLLRAFAAESQRKVLVVVRSEDDIALSLEVLHRGQQAAVAFIKKEGQPVLDESPLGTQLQVTNLNYLGPDNSPYEVLHTYLQHGFAPLFQSFKGQGAQSEEESKGGESKIGLAAVQKKISEAMLALMNCQQNVDIPDVYLQLDPTVKQKAQEARSQNARLSLEMFEAQASDKEFLASLIACVDKWIHDINKVTRLANKDHLAGSILHEVNFWQVLTRALTNIDQTVKQPEVCITLDLLKQAKRIHTMMSFNTDTGLEKALQICTTSNLIMHDFPVNDLLSANTIENVERAVVTIFNHMKKIKHGDSYPVAKAQQIVDLVSKDVMNQMLKVLGRGRLMALEWEEFHSLANASINVFKTWGDQHKAFKDIIRNKLKQQGGKPSTKKVFEHTSLEERMQELLAFRENHEKLREVVSKVFTDDKQGDVQALREINLAYQNFSSFDVLELSKEGHEMWEQARKQYELKIDRVESQITAKLRDKLGSAKSANEMFRVFSKFNALFFRPRIRGAIQEYQTQLISQVRNDIQVLQDKFKRHYNNTEAAVVSKVRDFPEVSSAIIWAKQIERKLQVYLRRVEDVLGQGWETHMEGKKLKDIGDAFSRKLSTQKIVEKWIEDMLAYSGNIDFSEMIFDVVSRREKQGQEVLELVVNFDEQVVTLFKEVRSLVWLGFGRLIAMRIKADDFKTYYPYAIGLQEALRTYSQANKKVDDSIKTLLAQHKKDLIGILMEGSGVVWNSEAKLDKYVKKLMEKSIRYEEKVTELLERSDQIAQELEGLKVCPIKHEEFALRLSNIQKIVDEFSLNDLSNLESWVQDLDCQIEAALTERARELLSQWTKEFQGYEELQADAVYVSCVTVHEIHIRDQLIYLDPPLEEARKFWTTNLHRKLYSVCGQQRIEASRYEILSDSVKRDYSSVMHHALEDLRKAYESLDQVLGKTEQYVSTWLGYQALWDTQPADVFKELGDDMELWQKLLNEIKDNRTTFDTTETEIHFGPIVINYRSVQVKVNNKYDQWHKEILNKFGSRLAEAMRVFNGSITNARLQLEKQSLDSASTDVTLFVTEVQELRRNLERWQGEMNKYRGGQQLLTRQRYHFPNEWLWIDQLEGDWSTFKQILSKKSQTMEAEIPTLQAKILNEERVLTDKMKELAETWKTQRPYSGDISPPKALEILNLIEGKVKKTKEDYVKICKAKDVLSMEAGNPEKLDSLEEDIKGLKDVWTELHRVWGYVEAIRDTPWSGIVAKKVREALEKAMEELNHLPNRLRNYEAYDTLKGNLNTLKKTNILIIELKSEALKDRHWKLIMQRLKMKRGSFNDLTLGNVWDAEILKHEKYLREVLGTAQGEMGLEEFLKQVREYWQAFNLDLANYQNKCRLIRGWDDLFTKLDEHINSLNSMKMSPHYKVFEEEVLPWDEKLQKIRVLFDIWIDVQRRWVYLEGIFCGSADIKQQLPNEFSKFKSIDNEFTSLMRKVSAKPLILDVLGQSGIQKTLERLAELLAKIQKALGDYLETQRLAFPRFYFVGDEDLLEIIGNSRDIVAVQRHFAKMFAGISSLKAEDTDLLVAMTSREDEIVPFAKFVRISEDPAIHAWLTKVEDQMRASLAVQLEGCVMQMAASSESFVQSANQFPAQISLLSTQVEWSHRVESNLTCLPEVEQSIQSKLISLAEQVLQSLKQDIRKKYEQLITDLVHQRDVTRALILKGVTSAKDFDWLVHMRFYWSPKEVDPMKKLVIEMSNANFYYGFEYLGVGDKLVQTPLTDRCYLTLTQALHMRLGGNPFGPAGTGKTESVKALGTQLGRFVLVFNCDETFDFQAMGRIFVGLCQVGAWGCFDEFNRLEERMLSAVSQQILVIQTGLMEQQSKIELLGKEVKLKADVGIFVTMNPGYAGRSNLPDNLKQLFRQIAMVKPDKELIAQVMLYSQGFRSAERLSTKIVSLFDLCNDQLSSQSHYDFGLRALKSVLVSAGNLKRQEQVNQPKTELDEWEQQILLRSVCETIVPKLVADDVPLLSNLLSGVFPGSDIMPIEEEKLKQHLISLCKKHNIIPDPTFIEKVLQLYQILRIHHGVMMVGPSGSGKSAAWKLLLEGSSIVDERKGESYIIDPKAITKDELYGKLDSTTLEWTDGVFTQVLRKILDNVRGESNKRHWIIFDGDVDPDWAENLNSVLDDNKLLTLPNGERLRIPPNVKIMFEVETLKYATLATVSRCGMVWFSADTVNLDMIYSHYLSRLQQENFDDLIAEEKETETRMDQIRKDCVSAIRKFFQGDDCYVTKAVQYAESRPHIMDFTRIRALEAMFALTRKGISNILEFNEGHPDFPMTQAQIEEYMSKWLTVALMWGVGGSLNLREREKFSSFLQTLANFEMPPVGGQPLLDYEVRIEDCSWSLWKKRVPNIEIETHRVVDADVVIPTIDTLRHQEILCSWLSEHRPFILCGPPGSGKTMTLMATLKALTDFEMIFVNFSSSTTPSLILKTFDHYCEYTRTPNGIVLRPHQPNKWLVVFCDEINLPDEDKYGTQAVITFLRQLTEQYGFWRPSDRQWVSLERIQFVGACNPPTDAGRHPLSLRFLRHSPLIFVDFPGRESLVQIFGTFNRAMLKRVPSLRGHAQALTEAMVEFYSRSQDTFTADIQPHYIYSPRELTRWKYAMFEALEPCETLEDLVRLFAHEGLRLFQDRMVQPNEKEWCDKAIDEVVREHFPMAGPVATQRPILFSTYLSKFYMSVDREALRKHTLARMKVFNEEELNVPLVVFDSVLDHICRIDRVLRQPLGHLLLVGASGTGKTTLTRFVSWMNNLSVFQIKAGRNYSVSDFDDDLRGVMKRAGCKAEKICFIFDESNVLSTAFLERMNALLASGEVPGLFDGEEYMALMGQCKESAQREGKLMDTEEELYRNFIYNVQRNLHVVFTMNPANPDFSNRAASSPALFNRCVIDWFGDWPAEALTQVATEFTQNMDLIPSSFSQPAQRENPDLRHEAIVGCITYIHNSVVTTNAKLAKSAKKYNYITPRDFLDFIKHFVNLYGEKKSELEEQQLHLNTGLGKLRETEDTVKNMQASLAAKRKELELKEQQANEKLQLMVAEQKQAEQKREASIKMTQELEIKDREVKERQEVVNNDLAKAEPALIEAQSAVRSIKKKNLDEIRAMANPPTLVKMTLEGVASLIGGTVKTWEWSEVRGLMRKDDFISTIVDYRTENLSPALARKIVKTYLESPEWNIEKIFRASTAAGPLAKWVESQVNFSNILDSVAPLKKEVAELESQGNALREQYQNFVNIIQELEQNIEKYKADYAALISEVQQIKSEMTKVQEKVTRSRQLISNLSSERERWDSASLDFQRQMSTMLGDVLTAGAFLGYIGYFDHFHRQSLLSNWKEYVDTSGICFRHDISLVEFLSKPHERLLWKAHYLPDDNLCVENAIILQRFNRYPLVIDPAGQATEFLMAHHAERKITKVSLADDSFLKNLESALRFGCPILVEDVERIDPVLNSVLNKEVHKTGGRVLIHVGDLEIDFSPNFTMYMVTRDANANFTPDLCSRVTFVNFTVTTSSLQNQCLNIFLKSERPDVDHKRSDLLKLQGEYKVRLRELEESLLKAINESRGNILDDDSVISTLETLKKEATVVAREAARTEEVMKEVEQVSNEYVTLASAASRIYFAMESLSEVHFLYHFSLQFFMTVVSGVLKSKDLSALAPTDYEGRLQSITHNLFVAVYSKVSRGMLETDKLVFALRLMQIRVGHKFEEEMDIFLKGNPALQESAAFTLDGRFTDSQAKELSSLTQRAQFQNLIDHMRSDDSLWMQFMDSPTPEQEFPQDWGVVNPIYKGNEERAVLTILEMTVLKILRPDRMIPHVKRLISSVLGEELLSNQVTDLTEIVQDEATPKSPLLLCAAPGFDPSQKVDKLAKHLNKRYTSVALGSAEGFDQAEKAIAAASRTGTWVLLKNVHLAPSWLVELEKKLHRMNPHDQFRLFLTMEIQPKVPTTLLRVSTILVFESPPGIKSSLQRSFKTVLNHDRTDKAPVERSRLHFLLCWFHAVMQERLRFTPIGWTKAYEFSEADQRCTLDAIDEWMDNLAQGRSNIPPEKIPWDALRALIAKSLYGGRVDNEFDDKILESFVDQLFCEKTFDPRYSLFSGEGALTVPDCRTMSQFASWIEALPGAETPEWAGLPSNAEKLLRSEEALALVRKLLSIQSTGDEELAYSEKQESSRSAWLLALNQRVQVLYKILPGSVQTLHRTSVSITNPLFRFFEREISLGEKLLQQVKTDLTNLKEMTQGNIKSSNELRKLALDLHNDKVPKAWVRYAVAPTSVNDWLVDFKKRLDQLNELCVSGDFGKKGVWLGGFFFPEAYMTATRQATCQRHKWSLDELILEVAVGASIAGADDDGFIINNLHLQSAEWGMDSQALELTPDLSHPLPSVVFRWVRSRSSQHRNLISIPVYLNYLRNKVLFSVELNGGSLSKSIWYQRGTAITTWNRD